MLMAAVCIFTVIATFGAERQTTLDTQGSATANRRSIDRLSTDVTSHDQRIQSIEIQVQNVTSNVTSMRDEILKRMDAHFLHTNNRIDQLMENQ